VTVPFDDELAIFTVGQVASMLGVQPAFVRRLDAEQVVEPARSDGGHRRYTRSQMVQVQRVSEIAGEGLTLPGIRRILLLEAALADVRRQVAELQAAAGSASADDSSSKSVPAPSPTPPFR
jgi:MerR family transcriptional regulator/heat shock protein HspR